MESRTRKVTKPLRLVRPTSIVGRLVLGLSVMLVPVVAVAAADVVTFRVSVGAMEDFTREAVEEVQVIGALRDTLVSADDFGEAYVEIGDRASGEAFAEVVADVEEEFDSLERALFSAREGKVVAKARLLWEEASEAASIAASGPPSVQERELDHFHDAIDEAASTATDLYRANLHDVSAEIASLKASEQMQLIAGLLILLLSSIAVFIIASRLRRSITEPLQLLERAATEFGSDNLSHRIPVQGQDELAHVSDAFNQMAQRLEQSREDQSRSVTKIERLNAELEQKVATRTHALEEAMHELEGSMEMTERASRAKSEFLSRTSHELRTPLNAILGFGQLLEGSTLSDKDRRSVDRILKGGRHLLGLIDDVLDISRFDEGKTPFSLESVALREVLAECVDLIRPQMNAREIRLEADSVDPSWFVHADRQRLRQVLTNVLSNAVKYNHEGGTIRVDTFRADGRGRYVLRVTDSGPGIPSEQFDRLFMPFDRLGAERTDVEGTGLGLALSKALVEAMGGRISAQNQEGGGAAFLLELRESADPRGSLQQDVDQEATPQQRSLVGTVLCLEDNASNLALIEESLRFRPGVALLMAKEGVRGVELAKQRPSLVLLDLHLPDISGEEVLRRLREDTRTADIPVVITSADATPSTIARLRDAGANDYLTKPLDIAALLAVLDHFLGSVSEQRVPSLGRADIS